MSKAVVIGGSGFLGSHVADCLSAHGFETVIFDENYSEWLSDGQHMIVGNILDEATLNYVLKGAEVVYNFAALADLNQALRNPRKTIEVNILGNLLVMEACKRIGVKRYIFASTVYVNSRHGGFYRCSKHAAESYVEEFHKEFGLEYTILRYGSLYGPRSDDSNSILRILKEALKIRKISYCGHIDAMREYIHVQDAASGSVAALEDKFRNQSVVLTGHEPMKVVDVLKMIAEILGLKDDDVSIVDVEYPGHYVRTPYSYQPKLGMKYIPPIHVDLGQGLIQLINEIDSRP